ncbi:CPBP family intramembrane glutamic endopeptidase [Longimicrobium sp.]|uniref:CPBP family intramembrane glutamic endopeptidase n=1 Tax=Longimicrobium sp. TaxID=2029185 RepID=UPI002BEAD48F|nr:CPBP family intramembrane glutamic endopeptidase [Longimicrobium sp.]HSU12584.1 CPBP family intramembrane glutamic endopeptidase [Longimicrobium sp.]
MKTGERIDAALMEIFVYVGLVVLALAWTAAVTVGMIVPAIPAIPACAAGLALFAAAHLRTPAQRERAGLRRVPLPGWAILAAAAAFVAFKLGFDTLLLRALPHHDGPDMVGDWLRAGGGWGAIVATGVLAGPFIEEVGFRGWIQGRLARRLPPAAAIGITAVVFAAAHFSLRASPTLLVAGLVFGYAFHATGSLWTAVLLHVAANATAAAMEAGLSIGVSQAAVIALAGAAVLVWLALRFPPRRAGAVPAAPPASPADEPAASAALPA